MTGARDNSSRRRLLYSLVVRFGKPVELMNSKPDRTINEADGKSTRPLRFGIAGRDIDSHGCLPLVKDTPAYHGFQPCQHSTDQPLLLDGFLCQRISLNALAKGL
jgi:hypothetical protein